MEAQSARVARPRTAERRHQASRAALRAGSTAPLGGPAPASGGSASAAASTAGSAASATALLALLFLLAFAAPRLGGLLRLFMGWAPMPPVLALPERPG